MQARVSTGANQLFLDLRFHTPDLLLNLALVPLRAREPAARTPEDWMPAHHGELRVFGR